MRQAILTLLLLLATGMSTAQVAVVNWENHPVNALSVSPDGRTLAVAHTADHRVQLFDVTEGRAVPLGHVAVGLDPVSVRFRTNRELWVANHISDTVSVVDVDDKTVIATLDTADEPADIVFANNLAFVTCSQENLVRVFAVDGAREQIADIPIAGEDPRAMAVNSDGSQVFVAIFESGNGTTLLGGGIEDFDTLSFPPNVTRQSNTPYGGQNPPPNNGSTFSPALNPTLPPAPKTSLIVRKNAQGQWLDDNGENWTALVSGPFASQSGRTTGWDLPDRDIAIINTADFSVSYAHRLMNLGMAIGYNPATDEVTLVGTEALNEVRFEPVINGRFLRVEMARVSASNPGQNAIADLNPHLDYSTSTVAESVRERSIGDPRGIVWQADGLRGYVAGMGSNNIIVIDQNGARVGDPIEVGQGPTGLALAGSMLYAWNHFDASLSAIDTSTRTEIERLTAFNPLPPAIREGRPFLYDTHETSGLGHISCASCHVDARIDRLAWDLGDPSGEMKSFNQNCTTDLLGDVCEDFHPMKGPMMTQTFQDIIGHEPFHWRGDRDGIEEFNPAFEGLMGRESQLTTTQMQQFEDFLATIVFPPNPFRNLDNTLPTALALDGHYTTGRFGPAGQPLGTGNAVRGLDLYVGNALDSDIFHCANCHTLPTGMAVNGATLAGGLADISTGGSVMATGPLGENHLGIISTDGSSNISMKVPQLRNMYEKTGLDFTQGESNSGFGFFHDGGVDSLARFVSLVTFQLASDQDVADLVALMLAFSGSEFPRENPPLGAQAPLSGDTHAAVGRQFIKSMPLAADLITARSLAAAGKVDLIGRDSNGIGYQRTADGVLLSDGSSPITLAEVPDGALITVVPKGLGGRLALDRDGDGIRDHVELAQGSNPADALSQELRPSTGLWYNPNRGGHGFDLQLLGDSMFVTWYTYEDDGTPVWYQAAGPFSSNWSAPMNRFTFDSADGSVAAQEVGSMQLDFSAARSASFTWHLGERTGTESVEPLPLAGGRTLRNYTGTWFDPTEPGWGITLYSEGDIRIGVLYYYDANNQPRWSLGQSDNAESNIMEMLSFEGFCPDCDAFTPTNQSSGTLAFDLGDLREGFVTTNVSYPDGGPWEREDRMIIPLNDPPADYHLQ